MKKSLISPWTKEEIEKAPTTLGIFILRSTPVNGDILRIEATLNIKEDLLKNYENSSLSRKL